MSTDVKLTQRQLDNLKKALMQSERRVERLLTKNEFLRVETFEARKRASLIQDKYENLYRSCKAMGKEAGLIIHLEDMWRLYENLYLKTHDAYQKHLDKYARFYSDWENRKK